MNPLAKGIRDYLALRRGLGFKLVRHEAGLKEFASSRPRNRFKKIPLAWLWVGAPPQPPPPPP
jgi:integrase/recombinase XerD